MSTSNNRTCVVCGRSYKACRNCEDAKSKGLFRWRSSCDTPQCFQVLMVINDFYYEKISKQDARNLLDDILTEEMKPYDENARTLIDRIYELDEYQVVEEIVEDIDEEEILEIAPEDPAPVEEAEKGIPQDDMFVDKEPLEIDYYDNRYEYPQGCEETY